MHRHGFRKSLLYQRPVAAMTLTTKFAQKVMQLFEKDFNHFPKFLLKRKVAKSATLFQFHNRSTKKLIKNCAMSSCNSKMKL